MRPPRSRAPPVVADRAWPRSDAELLPAGVPLRNAPAIPRPVDEQRTWGCERVQTGGSAHGLAARARGVDQGGPACGPGRKENLVLAGRSYGRDSRARCRRPWQVAHAGGGKAAAAEDAGRGPENATRCLSARRAAASNRRSKMNHRSSVPQGSGASPLPRRLSARASCFGRPVARTVRIFRQQRLRPGTAFLSTRLLRRLVRSKPPIICVADMNRTARSGDPWPVDGPGAPDIAGSTRRSEADQWMPRCSRCQDCGFRRCGFDNVIAVAFSTVARTSGHPSSSDDENRLRADGETVRRAPWRCVFDAVVWANRP